MSNKEKEKAREDADPKDRAPETEEENDILDKLIGEEKSDQEKTEEIDWEQKFKTLEGKYRAEVPRQAKEIRQLRETINQLQAQIAQLQQGTQTRSEQRPAAKKYLDPEDEALVGSDEIEATAKVARGVSEEVVEGVRREIDQIKRNMFHSALKGKIKDLDRIQNDPGFMEWLKTNVDPYSGFSYAVLFNHAYETADAERAANIIRAYQESVQKKKASAEEAEDFRSQPKGRPSSPEDQLSDEELKNLTPQKIAEIYRKRAQGQLSHLDEAAWRKLEERIHKARMSQLKGG